MQVSVRRADERAEPYGTVRRRRSPASCRSCRRCRPVRSDRVADGRRLLARPGTPAFVEVGDVVVPGQTLCLLEAMKLFNELKAEAAGRVSAIHAENGRPVEFGQLLFELEPIAAPPTL